VSVAEAIGISFMGNGDGWLLRT